MLSIILRDKHQNQSASAFDFAEEIGDSAGIFEVRRYIEWHIGQPFPLRESLEDIGLVLEVTADCDELDYIVNMFSGIPLTKLLGVIHWYGDHAKFIAANLR